MQVADILVPFLLIVLIGTSAAAGASYISASAAGKSKNRAIGKLAVSIIIAVAIAMIGYR
jgi:hypothetical protein